MLKTIKLLRSSVDTGPWWWRDDAGFPRPMVCEDWGVRLGIPSDAQVEVSDTRKDGFTKVTILGLGEDSNLSPVRFGRHKIPDSYSLSWQECLRKNGFAHLLEETDSLTAKLSFWVRITPDRQGDTKYRCAARRPPIRSIHSSRGLTHGPFEGRSDSSMRGETRGGFCG